MTARQGTSGKTVNRMLHIDESASRPPHQARGGAAALRRIRLCPTVPLPRCLQRALPGDPAHGRRARHRLSCALPRLAARFPGQGSDRRHCHDGRQGRSLEATRASRAIRTSYVHIAERRPDGIVIRGTKAIVTGAPYVHEFLVMPCRTHTEEDKDFRGVLRRAVRCARRDDRCAPRRSAGRERGKIFRQSTASQSAW